MELAVLERWKNPIDLHGKKRSLHVFSAVFDRIQFILAGNKDMHKSFDEFEVRSDPTTDYRVGCIWVSKIDFSTFSAAIDLILFQVEG